MAYLCNEPNIFNNNYFCNNRINVLIGEEVGRVVDITLQQTRMTNINCCFTFYPQNVVE